MVSQRCPRCASERVRRGYRPTPVWSKVLFRYNLLCDNCNWEFKGFAIPGTVSTKPTKRKKTNTPEQNARIEKFSKMATNNDSAAENSKTHTVKSSDADGENPAERNLKKKRVKIDFKQ
jgi:hypothetical protein